MVEPMVNNSGKYLYTIIADNTPKDMDLLGIGGSKVYVISNGCIAAVVSDIASKRIRPERRNLATHQTVIKHLMKNCTPLPVAFGVIANDEKSIKKILSNNQNKLTQQLNKVDGKVEMGLRVCWDVPNIFEYFVKLHSDLRIAREYLLDSSNRLTQQDKIEIGRMFESKLRESREVYTNKICKILLPCCSEIKENPPRNEYEIMSLACLVKRDKQQEFEAAIVEAANLFDDNFVFDFNGPWAPHNFVNVELQL